CGRHCFVNLAIDHKPLGPKRIPCDQNRDRNNSNGNFCPRFHFPYLLHFTYQALAHFEKMAPPSMPLISPPPIRTEAPVTHFASGDRPASRATRQSPPALRSGQSPLP